MYVFFEDDGAFKAGTVLADNDTSLQVEAASGKRLKIKAAHVLLRFADPSPSALLADAQTLAAELDPNFLWEVSGEGEFAFSELAGEYFGHLELGIHIAAPAVAITRGSPLDAIARERLSTVYMPGRKITMLPDEVIERFTLAAGATPPVVSLYIEAAPDGTPLKHVTRLERIPIAANLRLDAIGERFAEAAAPGEPEWTDELRVLWRVAQKLEAVRGKTETQRVEYSFRVDWDAAPDGRVAIVPRPRGSPLDKLVAELMIYVNSTWGKVLADAIVPGLYRTQTAGKVKMSTTPEPHQGLGVAQYLWASSPLRRYSDLVNQQQLLAVVGGAKPPYPHGDAQLFAAAADFESTYAQYAEFQSRMEQYWCLRWLIQEHVQETTATVLRENLVRFDALPLVLRVADMPPLAPESRVRLAIGRVDLLEATLEARYAGLAPD